MHKVVVVTGASSRVGRATSKQLARAGHTVYATMRDISGRNARCAEAIKAFAQANKLALHVLELDVSAQASVDAAINTILSRQGRLDVVVHNAGQIVFGPVEAFTPEQLTELYDTNVVSAQRVSRATLPQLRKQGHGLVIWISSSSARGAASPFLGAYASSKASLDALALGYAGELARWGIETTIIVPCAFGPNHYLRSGRPEDAARAEEYADGPTADISEMALKGLASLSADTDPLSIARAVAKVVDTPFGERPLRVHFQPDEDGAAEVDEAADRARAELLRRIGLADLLKPAVIK